MKRPCNVQGIVVASELRRAARASQANTVIADLSAVANAASPTMPSAVCVLPPSGTVIDASSTTCADMTDNVSASDSHACVARAEVLIKATGLSTNSPRTS